MAKDFSTLDYDQAIASGLKEFPETRKNQLTSKGLHNFAVIDCSNPANFHKVCGQYQDQNGNTVYSYCDQRGLCGHLFLIAP